MRIRRYAFVCGGFLAIVGLAFWLVIQYDGSDEIVQQARRELRKGNAESALKIVQDLLESDPDATAAARVEAMAYAELGEYARAAELWIALNDSAAARDLFFTASQRCFSRGQWSESADLLRKCLDLAPDDLASHRQLATILNSSAQRWDARIHGKVGIGQMQFSITELLLFGNPEEPYIDESLLLSAAKKSPDDPLVLCGLAVSAIRSNDVDRAVSLLRRAVSTDSSLLEPQAMLGGLLLDRSDIPGFLAWNNSLPADAKQHSEIWYIRGCWAQSINQLEAAARCFWEATLLAPDRRKACFQLGQVLTQLNRGADAERFLRRAEQLAELHRIMRPVYFEAPNPQTFLQIARLMESLGREEEALAWYFTTTRFSPEEPTALESMARLRNLLSNRSSDQVPASHNPAREIDLSELTLPTSNLSVESDSATTKNDGTPWIFRDEAAAAGIHFQYFNSDDPQTEGKRMFETTGGGVAVADFDNNGWPDIYLTQGCRWPIDESQREFADHCYLNTGRGIFRECAQSAGLLEFGYGQGVSAADFDNDGFEDLYVANIGGNRCFRNNGDGTFQDLKLESRAIEESWTTSCVATDLNGDGFPDLYDANYLSGAEAFTTICGKLHPRTCSPATFNGSIPGIHLNSGDGSWLDATSDFGISDVRGKSLGVVAVRLSPSPIPDLLIANDGEANFLFRSLLDAQTQQQRYTDVAIHSGVAFDREGMAQACMGIAVDDFNGDSRLDFFVTNFLDESNTLYIQKSGYLFVDETREFGLRNPSLQKLGFGTQSLDCDLDGFPDLVVANGHVDDFSYDGKPYRMPPQIFANRGGVRFDEVAVSGKDSYFAGQYLGRGMARIDWNRDGHEDFVVSHLDSPAALVTNLTESCGNSVAFRLTGVNCSRDAIGTNVTVTCAGKTHTRQLTAGDGYQASNERILVFGVGNLELVSEVTIDWPSGLTQTLHDIRAGIEHHIVEGRDFIGELPFEGADRN